MVHVPTHVLQVVVFAAGSHTFLTVDHAAVGDHLTAGVHGAQEDGLELKPESDTFSSSPDTAGLFQRSDTSKSQRQKIDSNGTNRKHKD